MRLRPRLVAVICVAVAMTVGALPARAQPDGVALVRLLGARAAGAFAPARAPAMGALVRLPSGVRAADLGLGEVAPGLGRLWGTPAAIASFGDAHPELSVEVSPPLHLLLDTAGAYVGATVAHAAGHEGASALVGIADTGIDVTHADFLDATGGTRVAWLLDLSAPPRGVYPDLESRYGSTGPDGTLVAGAVWAKVDIDQALTGAVAGAVAVAPQDEIGHGTLVAACAAGQDPRYGGMAPQAGLVVARIAEASGSIGNDEMLRGVAFLFDRADFLGKPIAVNLSVGTDFGPHDGTLDWEQALASHVGAAYPGHALVVAAGNSGSIAQAPVHQNVHVSPGATVRVPLVAAAATVNGAIGVWVALHAGADLAVGLDGPFGTWIPPVAGGGSAGADEKAAGYDATAAIDNDSRSSTTIVPAQSHGAVVTWAGQWPAATFFVTLTGTGTADLYVQGDGDVGATGAVGFASGVREGTINLPATNPAIIAVGCTINKTMWQSAAGLGLGLQQPVLDMVGGQSVGSLEREPTAGEPCWFSSAGPTLTGQPKPEIMAPGAAIVGALSAQAVPPAPASIFTAVCPSADGGAPDPGCLQIDATHGVESGTSFSAPLVAGAVALLFERDPTLTQDQVVAALQGGAHPLRGAAPFFDDAQSGPGELDVVGSLAVVDQLQDPRLTLPSRPGSWLTFGADTYLADGSTPLTAIVELRTARAGTGQPLPADGFDPARLSAYLRVDGSSYGGPPGACSEESPTAATASAPVFRLCRTAPGVWAVTVELPAGLGGSSLTVGATFDGADIVEPRTLPIATDVWNAEYAPDVRGGCSIGLPAPAMAARGRTPGPVRAGEGPLGAAVAAGVAASVAGRRRRRAVGRARR
jgi:Subtilase family